MQLDEPVVDEYIPTLQATQVDATDAPSIDEDNPAAHAKQVVVPVAVW